MNSRPRMLFLSGLFPLPVASGGQQRTMQLLAAFRRRFDVTLLTHAAHAGFEPHVHELQALCTEVIPVVPANRRGPLSRLLYKLWFWARRLAVAESSDRFYNAAPNINAAIDAQLRRNPFDIVFAMYWFWHPRIYETEALTVIDTNDVQVERQAKLLQQSTSPIDRMMKSRLLEAYRRREAAALRRADLLVAVTERDRDQLHEICGGATEVLVTPTGIDTDYFAPQPVAHDTSEIVFFGSLRNAMNQDAVRYLAEEILPRIRKRLPEIKLTIAGASPTEEMRRLAETQSHVRLTGFLEDVRPVLARAGVVVCPLRFGYGIRGRVLETLGLGVPVVATPVAVAGMGLSPETGVVLADDPQSFADATIRVLEDPDERALLAARGRDYALREVSLDATYGRLARELERRLATRSGAVAAERVP